ncbi:chorismate-binding protein [Hydrogenophilus thermoluteolus]|uniref:PARA-aminobenzoate synthetase component I n=1 Tax=Hydrogenophilus thermoluteolus TaxID=297 RepID=A0A2Z6DXM9_HYDTE|nr:bifunctional anthranilate synthase component I family protein/class IV aminotransferase [Hydrogenophilus thermoluteolus]BBD77207.1 PARA-aminobenzoate synthetase component I [Hydrogenophilus thermoluteolus]
MFAWFDLPAENGNVQRRALWAEPLTAFHETSDAAAARTLLTTAEDEAKQSPASSDGPFWAFALDYECAPWFDHAFSSAFTARPAGRLRLWRFARYQTLSDRVATQSAHSRVSDPIAGLLNWRCAWDQTHYYQAVERILHYLREGDSYQVNLTFPWYAETYGDPLALYLRLHAQQPVPHGAYLPFPNGGAILCRSPERFFLRRGRRISCRPMKGTAPPNASGWIDDKTRAENVMIVDLIRNDLSRLSPAGGVQVPNLFQEERYATVTQLTSTIVAEGVDAPLWAILAALFPCGSVTGAPKRRAMEIIAELEPHPRGIYCGAIGYILPGGDVEAVVPIRTLTIDRNGGATYSVGSGIVIDSKPASEWQECLLKGRFVQGLPAMVGLIETLRWEPADGCVLWPYHIARIRASAKALGIPFDEAQFAHAVTTAAQEDPDGNHPLRIRAELAPDGTVRATATHWQQPATPVRFRIAREPAINPSDPLQRHKTTRRAHYDRLLAEALAHGCFDYLVTNTRGELVEGCRTTLFVQFPGEPKLATPPLATGCLAGVLRAKLLAEGDAVERPLTPADLTRAEQLYLGNALHGLLPAVWDDASPTNSR